MTAMLPLLGGAVCARTREPLPLVNLLPDGSGAASAPFTPLASPETGETTETLTATDALNAAITAQVTYRVTATELTMRPSSAKLGAKVTWRRSGFGAGNAYLHVARRNAKGKTVTVRTLKLGALTGPCGALTARTAQLPLARPEPGTTYLLRFNTRSSPTAAALVPLLTRAPVNAYRLAPLVTSKSLWYTPANADPFHSVCGARIRSPARKP